MPLTAVVTGANRTNMKKLGGLLDERRLPCPLVADPADLAAGPQLCLDRGSDYDQCRESATSWVYTSHITPKRSAARPLRPPGNPDRHPLGCRMVEVACRWFNRFHANAVGTQQ